MTSPFFKQTWVSMGVLFHMYGQGMIFGYPSVILPTIMSPDSEIKADLHVAAWVGISSIPGYFVSSCLMDWYGRKIAHIAAVAPSCMGWTFIWLSSNISMVIVGRILCGYTAGATVILGAMVIGEYTSPNNRGIFLNLKTTAACFGTTTAHVLGYFLHWKKIALIALIPHIVSILITLTWPESPSWLASKKKFELCEKSFFLLRGKSEECKKELEGLVTAQSKRDDIFQSKNLLKKVSEFCKKFQKKEFLKPVTIMFFGALLCEACGRHIFPAFAIQIIQEVSSDKSNTLYYTLGINIIMAFSSSLSSVLIKVLKRRTLLFTSGFSALFVLGCTCLYLYLSVNKITSKNDPTIAIMLFSIYFFVTSLGCTSITFVLVGELFPLAHRSAGSAVSGCLLSFWLFVAIQVTPYLLLHLKVYGTFTAFALVMVLSLITLYFILPETKDRTLQQIEDYFNFGSFRNDNIKDNDDDDDEIHSKMLSHGYN